MSRDQKRELEALKRLKDKAFAAVTAQLAQTREAVESRLEAVLERDPKERAA